MTAVSTPVVLITGASRGIGRGIARSVAELGCSLAVNYVKNAEAAKETVSLCEQHRMNKDQRFVPIQADIGVSEDRDRLVGQTLQELGRIDGLVNNAGVGPRVRADITQLTEDGFAEVLRTNLHGPIFLTQSVVKYWLTSKPHALLPAGFKIVFISSISANTASIDRAEYCLSKAGLAMAAQLWAVRLADEGIQVFEIRPGLMATDMTRPATEKYDKLIADGVVPLKRWGTPDDVGHAVKAILSGHFPFSTGQVINIDGGFHLRRL